MVKLKVYRQFNVVCENGEPHVHVVTLPENHYWMLPDFAPDKPIPGDVVPVYRIQVKGGPVVFTKDIQELCRFGDEVDLLECHELGPCLGMIEISEDGHEIEDGSIWNDDGTLKGIVDTTKCEDDPIYAIGIKVGAIHVH